MRAREWKRLIEEERTRLLEKADDTRTMARIAFDRAMAEAKAMEDSAEALERVLKLAEGDPEEDEEDAAT